VKIIRIFVTITTFALAGNLSAQTLTTLYSFTGGSDGAGPQIGLAQGSDGNFYGTTLAGGASTNRSPYGLTGYGTVFQISPSGSFTNLHSFDGSDGANPLAPLTQGSDSNFYGTTYYGGTSGEGAVFRISASGSYTTLYSFASVPNDGTKPQGVLVQGMDGNFYGTTFVGGAYGGGTIFRISPGGNYTNLHSFGASRTNGASPAAGLVLGSDGNFYGTTMGGGRATSCAVGAFQGCGTVFRFSPSGTFTSLYSVFGTFPCGDSAFPQSTLMQGTDGNFYGTADECVFRISASGTFTGLYCFAGSGAGYVGYPTYGLMQGSDGCFYGTTGTSVFRISASGTFTSLYSFAIGGLLVQGSDGDFYGIGAGVYGQGSVVKISFPLNPPANQISTFQPDSSGTNLVFGVPSVAGETYQLQFTTDLTSGIWSNVPNVSVTNSIGSMLNLTNFGGASRSRGFYRFDITP